MSHKEDEIDSADWVVSMTSFLMKKTMRDGPGNFAILDYQNWKLYISLKF